MQVFGFDTETTPINYFSSPELRLWCLTGKTMHHGFTMEELLNFLLSLTESTVIVAHHLDFDFFVTFRDVDLHKWFDRVNIDSDGSRPNKCLLSRKIGQSDRVTIHFLDLGNYFQEIQPLEVIAKDFNVQPKMDQGLTWDFCFEEELQIPPMELLLYCFNDADIVYRVYTEWFFMKDRRGSPKPSISSLAFYELKEMSGWNPFTRPHWVKDWEKETYFGGIMWVREDTRKQWNKVRSYDLNSAYSDAMRSMKVPTFFVEVVKPTAKYDLIEWIEKLIKWHRGSDIITIIHCRVDAKTRCLPQRTKAGVFRVEGEFIGKWVCEELIPRVIDNEVSILEIYGIAIYDAKQGMFQSFVDKNYEIKRNSKGAKRNSTKLKLNSCYGKFGQRARIRTKVTDERTISRALEVISAGETFRVDGRLIRIRNGEVFSIEVLNYEERGKCTIIASIVTARVRCKMWEEMIRPYNPIYCDTDSGKIFFDQEFDKYLISSDKLGAWKEETHNPLFGDFIKVFGSKDYQIHSYNESIVDIRKHKGIPASALELEENTFYYQKVVKRREAIVRHLEPFTFVRMQRRRLKWA